MLKLILLTTIFFLPSLAFANDHEEIEKLIETYTSTVTSLDMAVIRSIWSKTDNTSFIHPRGHETGWENIRESFYLNTMGRFAKRNLAAHRINIRLTNPTSAWGDFYWTFNATFEDGTNIVTEGRETQIWEKIDGDWKIVHVHYSGLPASGDREGF